MKFLIKAAFVFTLVAFFHNVSATTWTNFSNYTEATSIAVRGEEVWMSAKGGLVMYQKQTGVKTFFKKSPGELPSLSVERVAVHPQTSDIWIGTYDNGLAVLHGDTWTHIAFPDSGAMLYEMKIAANGAVWAATSRGLYRYENSQFTKFMYHTAHDSPWDIDLFPNGKILCSHFSPFIFDPAANSIQLLNSTAFAYGSSHVFVKSESEYYFGTDHGDLARFSDTTEVDTVHLAVMMRDMAMNSAGELLLLKDDFTLHKQVNNKWVKTNIGPDELACFAPAENGEVWAGGAWATNKLIHVNSQNQTSAIDVRRTGLDNNWVSHISGSTDENVLIITESGVQKFDLTTRSFSQIALPPAVANSNLNEVIELNGKLYAGTSTLYLYEFSQATGWQQLGSVSLPHPEVKHFTKDAQGNLWMCGYGFVAKYDGSSFTVFDSMDHPKLKQYTRDIHYDATRDVVWTVTYDGIFKIENGTVTFYNDSTPGIRQHYDAVETIEEDAEHNIWFGTVYGGVLKYDGSYFSTLLLPVTVGNQFISDIEFIGDVLYVSDNLHGVWKYENNAWSSFNTDNSFIADDYVTALHADNEGNLWIGHLSYGIDVYNKDGVSVRVAPVKNELNAIAYPNPSEGKFILSWTEQESGDVHVYSAEGKPVQRQLNFTSGNILDLTGQASGIYLAEVRTKDAVKQLKLAIWYHRL